MASIITFIPTADSLFSTSSYRFHHTFIKSLLHLYALSMRTRRPSKRSPNTCAECRSRKVRCDGNRTDEGVGCRGCRRLKLDCSFGRADNLVNGVVQPDSTLEGRKKKLACTNCRTLKAKCDGEFPSCMRCLRKHKSCHYPSTRSLEKEVDGAQGTSSNTPENLIAPLLASTELTLPSLERNFVLRMIEAFFQHVHPIPVYSYLHNASLIQRFESGQLDHALSLTLAATTCELLDMGPELRAQSVEWMSQVEVSLMKGYYRPSVIKIQVLVMLVKHCMRQGRLSNAFMLHALACRGAFALGLNHEAPKLGFLARESRRRLMWSLYIIDSRLAGGMSDFALCSASSMKIQLPCHERNFEFDLVQDVENLQPNLERPLPESIGSLAIYIRLMWYRHRILHATKEAVLNRTLDTESLTASIEQLERELLLFEASLPQSLRFSSKGLQLRAYSTRLGPYLLIHVWLRQCYCDLYRIALTGLKEALPEARLRQVDPGVVKIWRRTCFESAMALAEVFDHFANLKNGCPVVEHDIVACAYQCARLLLHSRKQYADALQLDHSAVQERANKCLAATKAMQSRSHMGEMITQDLARLLHRGSSPSPQTTSTDANANSGDIPRLEANSDSRHLFSRHSAIGQMRILDDDTDAASFRAHITEDDHLTTTHAAEISHEAPLHDTTDFDFSNAFEGAFDDLDPDLHNMYWNPSIWLADPTDDSERLGMYTWN